MEVRFAKARFQKDCEDDRRRDRVFGQRRALELQKRLDDLLAADSLQLFERRPGAAPLPGRCHELKNRDFELSLDLDHPYRLIFRPDHDPVPRKPDGGLDWGAVSRVLILRIEDTHV